MPAFLRQTRSPPWQCSFLAPLLKEHFLKLYLFSKNQSNFAQRNSLFWSARWLDNLTKVEFNSKCKFIQEACTMPWMESSFPGSKSHAFTRIKGYKHLFLRCSPLRFFHFMWRIALHYPNHCLSAAFCGGKWNKKRLRTFKIKRKTKNPKQITIPPGLRNTTGLFILKKEHLLFTKRKSYLSLFCDINASSSIEALLQQPSSFTRKPSTTRYIWGTPHLCSCSISHLCTATIKDLARAATHVETSNPVTQSRAAGKAPHCLTCCIYVWNLHIIGKMLNVSTMRFCSLTALLRNRCSFGLIQSACKFSYPVQKNQIWVKNTVEFWLSLLFQLGWLTVHMLSGRAARPPAKPRPSLAFLVFQSWCFLRLQTFQVLFIPHKDSKRANMKLNLYENPSELTPQSHCPYIIGY